MTSGGVGSGGAIDLSGSGAVEIDNCTFVGNSAKGGNAGGSGEAPGGSGFGGAIFNFNMNLKLANCTITGNTTSPGSGTSGGGSVGGGVNDGMAGTVKSCIIAGNTAATDPDVSGSFTSAGFNLIGKVGGSTGFTAVTDLTGTIATPLDPKLDPNGLQDNGGPTQTIALLLDSPAIEKGSSAGLSVNLTTDQRGTGFPRVFDDSAIANAIGATARTSAHSSCKAASRQSSPTSRRGWLCKPATTFLSADLLLRERSRRKCCCVRSVRP